VITLLLLFCAKYTNAQSETSVQTLGLGANRIAAQKPVKKPKTATSDAPSSAKGSSPQADLDKTAAQQSKGTDDATPFGTMTGGNRGPINIESDSLALDYKQNAVLFTGHVHATQADAALSTERLWVKYGKDFHEVQHMTADGNVRISQGVRWCTSEHAVMDRQQQTVVLSGSPICHDAQDQVTGTKITVHLDTGKSDVETAKATIFPQQSKTRDNEALAVKTK
jgi:lipopolysaccharide export system protein LptA